MSEKKTRPDLRGLISEYVRLSKELLNKNISVFVFGKECAHLYIHFLEEFVVSFHNLLNELASNKLTREQAQPLIEDALRVFIEHYSPNLGVSVTFAGEEIIVCPDGQDQESFRGTIIPWKERVDWLKKFEGRPSKTIGHFDWGKKRFIERFEKWLQKLEESVDTTDRQLH